MINFDPFYHSRANDRSSINAIRGLILGVVLGVALWVAAVVVWIAARAPHKPFSTSNPCLVAPDTFLSACTRHAS